MITIVHLTKHLFFWKYIELKHYFLNSIHNTYGEKEKESSEKKIDEEKDVLWANCEIFISLTSFFSLARAFSMNAEYDILTIQMKWNMSFFPLLFSILPDPFRFNTWYSVECAASAAGRFQLLFSIDMCKNLQISVVWCATQLTLNQFTRICMYSHWILVLFALRYLFFATID